MRGFGHHLKLLSEELRSDHEVVLAAVTSTSYALQFASEELRSDLDVVLAAVTSNGYALQFASEVLRSDFKVVLAAVNRCPFTLQYASEELRSNRVVVLAAVSDISSTALQFASDARRSDQEVVLAAAKNDCRALMYVSGDILSCTTSESIAFVGSLLHALIEKEQEIRLWSHQCRDVLSELKAILIGLCQDLGAVDDFLICGDVMPVMLAQRWVTQLRNTQWCLDRACQNAAVCIDAQMTIERFTNIARDVETANHFFKYSHIIYPAMQLFGGNRFGHRGSNWWDLLRQLKHG